MSPPGCVDGYAIITLPDPPAPPWSVELFNPEPDDPCPPAPPPPEFATPF